MRRDKCIAGGGIRIREHTTDHESADTTRGSGFIGVGMKLSNTSRNRDKVCLTRNTNTSQESTQWVARGEAIGGSSTTDKRG